MVKTPLSILFAAVVVVQTHAVKFIPEVDAEDGRRLGGGKLYGHIQDDFCDLCIELKGGNTDNLTKLWWNKCKKGKKSQLWRFDKVTNNCSGLGKIHSKLDDDKCIQVNKSYKPMTRLRLFDCKNNRDHQKWNFCGDGIHPIKEKDLLVYSPKANGAQRYDPLVISDRNTWSLDFTEDPSECE
uniref:Ricin B lectin domain-containing protein n=1 Tax=Pseudictyota dubia TaxID=2749911 RepID=A0A7R9ZBN1_9STRA|mmetsp:Transcript_3571/g.6233  ORF Transcript_3571/g.6233 Transcript_3571/m.6233 type:complete len:183 (+) Transcript_3571:160-708(+)|eukprot:CAMPEP_0197441046 /NCGR_PEP_ID=MMETSP1175-20131217/7411_1 /TAXON_ID=1003142 /ORGANISM="Triceratium dubium, Strain CCMP147" /LENGTH=182 /DNA_ID=CAMNT_0042971269 /DNA_START=145 /DNA_END=693 /DNA_ORIENTATION=+